MNMKYFLFLIFFFITISCSKSDKILKFNYSPLYYPNSLEEDLYSFTIFTAKPHMCTGINSAAHVGWDFMPNWDSYPENKVPVIAVSDGVISKILPKTTIYYDGAAHDTFMVWLDVSKIVSVRYGFEPFISYGDENYAYSWLNISVGDAVKAGDIIGYLPKVQGNLGENLIHLDFQINVEDGSSFSFECPLIYFSDEWINNNKSIMINKTISDQCDELCK